MTRILLLRPKEAAEGYARLSRAFDAAVTEDWSDLFTRVLSTDVPGAVVVDAEMLSTRGQSLLEALHWRGLLVPTFIHFRRLAGPLVQRAWQLAPVRVEISTDEAELVSRLHAIAQSPVQAAADLLLAGMREDCHTSRRFLSTLAQGGDALAEPVAALAARCGTSRTTLYTRLARAGLPNPERCQVLFRLLNGVALLSRGASADRAAECALMADGNGFGKTLRRETGITIRQIRAGSIGWRDIVHAILQSESRAA